MSALVIMGLIVAVPFLLGVLLRVNAIFLFVSVAGGNLLVSQFGDDASLLIGSFVRGADSMVVSRLLLQFFPVLLMLLFARRTVGKGAVVLHVVPLLLASLTLGVFALSLVPTAMNSAVYESVAGAQIRQAQSAVIGVTVVSQLLLIWSTHRPEHHNKRHHKHK